MKGELIHYPEFGSGLVAPRNVDVWLPEGYGESVERYPVLYMHDGQNVFEDEKAFAGVAWGVDETITRLGTEEGLPQAIVVGIWNTPERIPEYMPSRPMNEWADPRVLARFRKTYGGAPKSDAYLRFLVDEVKPMVDGTYRTRPERPSTWIMGSSMGGLVSLYALCEHAEVFGAAGCISTSWTVGGRVLVRYLQTSLPRPGHHRLYFDYGAEAQIARYEALQKAVNRTVRRTGYQRESNWMTRRFPGAHHDEASWRARLDVPLRFLMTSTA